MTPRPKLYSAGVAHAAAVALAPDVAQWLEDKVDSSLIDDLAKAILDDTDGYALARSLERRWLIDPDAALVEILDEAGGHLVDAHRAALAAWVAENGITPQHAVGDAVEVDYARATHTGTITRIVLTEANYLVCIPALGHVAEGIGTHGIFFPFEDVRPLPSPTA